MNLHPLLLLIFLLPWSVQAAMPELIQDYDSTNYQRIVDHLPLDRSESFAHQEQYLLYKSLVKLGKLDQADQILSHLEENARGPVLKVLEAERLNLLHKRKELTQLLEVMAQLDGAKASGYLSRLVRKLLVEGYQHYPDPLFLQQSLSRIYLSFPSFQKDTKLLLLYLNSLPKGSRQRKETLLRLWMTGDVTHIPNRIRKEAGFIHKAPQLYRKIIVEHMKSQKKHRNYTYLRKNTSRFLNTYRKKAPEDFSVLRDLYFTSLLKTRKYTLALRTLNNPSSRLFFHFESMEEARWRFTFLMKKKRYREAADIAGQLLQDGYRAEAHEMFYRLGTGYFDDQKDIEALHYFNRLPLDELDSKRQEKTQWKRFQLFDRLIQRKQLIRIALWARKHDFESSKAGSKFCYWTFKLKLIKEHSPLECFKSYPFTYYGLKAKEVSSPYKQVYAQNLLDGPIRELRPLKGSERYWLSFLDLLYKLKENRLADSTVKPEKEELADLTWFHSLGKVLQNNQRYYLFHSLVAEHYDALQSDEYYGPHVLPLNYPRAFGDHIRKHARKAKVNEHLIFAVMREESRFRPYVRSPAGAIGLLQLMPATAKWMGKKVRMRVRTWQLTDPEINIRLGSAYLQYLQKRFSGNNYYTLAAYNGGATHVKRWKKAVGKKDIDYFVEGITFSETQNYVKRVMKSYYLYQAIYAKHL